MYRNPVCVKNHIHGSQLVEYNKNNNNNNQLTIFNSFRIEIFSAPKIFVYDKLNESGETKLESRVAIFKTLFGKRN